MPTTTPNSARSSQNLRPLAHGHWLRWLCIVQVLWLAACASLPDPVERPVSTALATPAQTRLGSVLADRAKKAGTKNDSGFALVGSAELAFSSRMTLIKAAEKTLDLQYYAIFSDPTTDRLFDALRQAAARGVRIRILLDDFNTSGKNAQVLKLAFEKNMELRLFNPLPGGRGSLALRILTNLHDVDRMQRRMHNKMLVADNAMAITGGRNLGETYFGQSQGTNFVDVDVLAAGRIARDLSRSFDAYWNNPLAYPVQSLMTAQEIEALKPAPTTGTLRGPFDTADAVATDNALATAAAESLLPVPEAPKDGTGSTPTTPSAIAPLPDSTDLRLLKWTWAPSTLLADKPGKIAADADSTEADEDTTVDGLLQLMAQAKTSLLIVSPYFVPGQRTMGQFADLRRRGVRVRVLTNSLASNDAPAAHVGYARYRTALLKMGVEIYEMRAEQEGTFRSFGSAAISAGSVGGSKGGGSRSRASLHSKVVVVDGRLLVVGSMNLDLRSQLQNSEVAVAIRNRTISDEASRLIEPTMATGAYRVELDGEHLVWRAPQGSTLPDSTTEPDTSALLRLVIHLLGPFAPEEML